MNIIETCKQIAERTYEDMKKRAKRRRMEREAAKQGVSVDVIEYRNFVEANQEKAGEVSEQYGDALAELGYKVDGRIQHNGKGEQRVVINLFPLPYSEYQDFLEYKKEKEGKVETKVEEAE